MFPKLVLIVKNLWYTNPFEHIIGCYSTRGGQCSSWVAGSRWPGFKPSGKEICFLFHFWVMISWLPFTSKVGVVSIGVIPTFKVIFTPLEYIPTIPPLSFYVIDICLYLAKTQWSLFNVVVIYSSGVKMTLKVWFTPMETTSFV